MGGGEKTLFHPVWWAFSNWEIERIWLPYHSCPPAIWAVTKHLERTGWDPFFQFFHQTPIEYLLGVLSTGLQEWTTQKRFLVSQAFRSILCFVSLPPHANGAGVRQRDCFSMGSSSPLCWPRTETNHHHHKQSHTPHISHNTLIHITLFNSLKNTWTWL